MDIITILFISGSTSRLNEHFSRNFRDSVVLYYCITSGMCELSSFSSCYFVGDGHCCAIDSDIIYIFGVSSCWKTFSMSSKES
jgi:hypothetical protein